MAYTCIMCSSAYTLNVRSKGHRMHRGIRGRPGGFQNDNKMRPLVHSYADII